MIRSKVFTKFINYNRINSTGSIKQYQSNTGSLLNGFNSIKSNNQINNNNNNNYNNNFSIQSYQKRDISFFTNVYNNFMQLVESNPEYVKLMEDFDRVFLNNRFKKQKEKEEQDKKDLEAKMEAYSKSAEQRAKEEAGLPEEEVRKRREEEQKLYEELLNQKTKKGEKTEGRPMPSGEVKVKTDGVSPSEQSDALKHLKDIYDKAQGIRPLPFEPNREEPTFENCQEFMFGGEFGLYDLDATNLIADSNPSIEYLTFTEQFNMAMDTYEDVGKFLIKTDLDARAANVKYDTIDWDDFIYSEEEFQALPKPYLEFLQRKLEMEFGDKIREMEAIEEKKLFEKEERYKEYENQEETGGRDLKSPDNPNNYPVKLEKIEIKPTLKDPIFIKVVDKLMDILTPPEKYATSYVYDTLIKKFYKGSPTNNKIINEWDTYLPETSLETLLMELRTDFLPNYFYHYFRGNLRELEQYTEDEYMEETAKFIHTLEGNYKILNHELLGISKINFCKFMNEEEATYLKVSIKVLHKMGLRDYNGNPIEIAKEERHGVYISHFRLYLTLDPPKNRFGWVVGKIRPSIPHKVLNLVPDNEVDQYDFADFEVEEKRDKKGKRVKREKREKKLNRPLTEEEKLASKPKYDADASVR
ncbi:hypothetical protein DICPUDRAFT_148654 [Dictyostelium purpureum]|uniref:Tim44-like domain-containing protein n=1 Tax=Dictyostelium purpureum TaxID=5786 RepID=F0ZBN3_DICPU|nr:uncharacterized protein DICPUDRAFT_148654 [Dictyostelium purpureum]EGC38653.1 hypothetical protein DICPUDRAFT_148654 [Dictyostelium purpureum]|eukprot:XP_003284846.1 hypothetical protein DICPUDRAFT_148654 [Dictyostelium purpureum]